MEKLEQEANDRSCIEASAVGLGFCLVEDRTDSRRMWHTLSAQRPTIALPEFRSSRIRGKDLGIWSKRLRLICYTSHPHRCFTFFGRRAGVASLRCALHAEAESMRSSWNASYWLAELPDMLCVLCSLCSIARQERCTRLHPAPTRLFN